MDRSHNLGLQWVCLDKVNCMLAKQDATLELLKTHITRAPMYMKQTSDQHQWNFQFEVGDNIFFKLQSYCMQTLAWQSNERLNPNYFGPYQIVARWGPVSSHLVPAVPKTSYLATLHWVFHVAQLWHAPVVTQHQWPRHRALQRRENSQLNLKK